jgi:hypothetical protein
VTICPCCGQRTTTPDALYVEGCAQCGALSVGPPLASPVHRLPSYGLALFVCATGLVLLLAFGVSTLVSLFVSKSIFSFGFWDLVGAAQTAAWRLKFVIPILSAATLWMSWRAMRQIRRSPEAYIGRQAAGFGLASSFAVLALTLTFIGLTIPERLMRRQLAIQASNEAPLHTLNRALIEYQIRYSTYPASKDDLKKLPDADGSIAAALTQMPGEGYSVSAEKASIPVAQTRKMRGGVRLQPIALRDNMDDLVNERISFTNYTLRLPGEDGVLGTDDDLMMRDGIILDREQIMHTNDANAPLSSLTPAASSKGQAAAGSGNAPRRP